MINEFLDPEKMNADYSEGNPFPHIVIDNFLKEEIANSIAQELEGQDVSNWGFDPHVDQVNKWFTSDLSKLQKSTGSALEWFNSHQALSFFEKLTGITSLIADPTYLGGGVHITTTGGRLGIHSDFNIHPNFGLHRRLNALLFLNREWDSAWNGQLQLWTPDMKRCEKSIEPIFNRLVIFNVNDTSFHGVPEFITCPRDKRRISLALYYYTLDRPEHEKGPFHWALWQKPNT